MEDLKYYEKAEFELENELTKIILKWCVKVMMNQYLIFSQIYVLKIALNTGYNSKLQNNNRTRWIRAVLMIILVVICKFGRPYLMIHKLMERNNIYNVQGVAKVGDTINDMGRKECWRGYANRVLSLKHE